MGAPTAATTRRSARSGRGLGDTPVVVVMMVMVMMMVMMMMMVSPAVV